MSPGSGLRLRLLDVSYNSLRKVPSLALSKTERIEELVLDGNLFLSLHPGTVKNINVVNISVSRNTAQLSFPTTYTEVDNGQSLMGFRKIYCWGKSSK